MNETCVEGGALADRISVFSPRNATIAPPAAITISSSVWSKITRPPPLIGTPVTSSDAPPLPILWTLPVSVAAIRSLRHSCK